MQIKNVLIVAKLDPDEFWHYSRVSHQANLNKVLKELAKRGVTSKVIDRRRVKAYKIGKLKVDLVLTFGGDGTFLTASHYLDGYPLLGINSAPKKSVGYYCSATTATFPKKLEAILKNKLKPKKLTRLEIKIGKQKLPYFALNEVLFANKRPADTSRYQIKVGNKKEDQKSSGLWIATPSGSTGAIYSAGGKREKWNADRVQYLVREPFRYPILDYKITKGFLKPTQAIELTTKTNQSYLFIDGPTLAIPIPHGKKIKITKSKCSLTIL